MKVTVVRSGGFAGMVQTTTVEEGDLSDDTARALRDTVAACSFEAPPDPAPAVRDGFAYEVRVLTDDGTEHRARFGQGRAPSGLDTLVTWVVDRPESRREIGR